MALVARIRATRAERQVGPRDAHAVIPPGIDTHEDLTGHVTIYTRSACRCDLMAVVSGIVVGGGQMALGADTVAFDNELVAMGVMAVGAGNARLMHFALYKRAVDIDFAADLTIGPVQGFLDCGEPVRVQ